MARPRKQTAKKATESTEAPKKSESTNESEVDFSEIKDQNNAKSDQSTDKAKEANEQALADQEEVIEVKDITQDKHPDDVADLKEEIKRLKAEKSGKVVDVKVSTNKITRLKPSEQNKITHTVIVKGKAREMSRKAYEAVSKDPALNVTLPKGSRLAEPMLDKPCEDC